MESLTGFIEIISRTKSILGLGTAVCIIESGRISSKAFRGGSWIFFYPVEIIFLRSKKSPLRGRRSGNFFPYMVGSIIDGWKYHS